MKFDLVDLTDTRKDMVVEIPSTEVDAAIARVAQGFQRAAKIPGFRPGKVPPRIVRQRYKDQILHEVVHELVPRAVDDVLKQRGVEPLDTPDVREVSIEEGQPLTFKATFDTVPPVDPGDYATLQLRRHVETIEDAAVDAMLERLRQRAAKYEAVEGRAVEAGDTVVSDVERRPIAADGTLGEAETLKSVPVDLGAPANPPGFDEALVGLTAGATKTFTVRYPTDHAVQELAGTEVQYVVTVHALKRRLVPGLDDEFAKDLGDFATLADLRARVRADLEHEAAHEADHKVRAALLQALATRVTFELPAPLVERELDRRVDDFAHRLMRERIDPRQANIDWPAFRESQREAAKSTVASTLVLDEVARRESLVVTDEDLDREIARAAEQSGRPAPQVRERLEKEGGISRLYTGLRREKAVDFLLARATLESV